MPKNLSITLGSKAFSVDFDTLPPAGKDYLIEYGFSQAMRDSQALGTAERIKKAIAAGILPEGTTDVADGHKAAFDAFLAGFLAERAQARFDSIVGGTIAFGGGERLSPEERIRRDVIDEMLESHAKAKGVTLPKTQAELRPLRDMVEGAAKAKIDAEVARRLKVGNALAEVDLGNIFG